MVYWVWEWERARMKCVRIWEEFGIGRSGRLACDWWIGPDWHGRMLWVAGGKTARGAEGNMEEWVGTKGQR